MTMAQVGGTILDNREERVADPLKALGNGQERIDEAKANAKVPQPGGLVQYGPTMSVVGMTQPPDSKVMLRLETTTGMHVFVLDPDHADVMGDNLKRFASQARTGLSLPPNGLRK